MERKALSDLKQWLNGPNRKPLVLRGARQVGKTWLIRTLAKQSGKKLIELNFERQRNLAVHFNSQDPKAILLNLESALNETIHPSEVLLFLDEIQAAPDLFATLRWFYEEMPELPVVAAGSLLEFVLEDHSFSMPVGRINYFFVEPLGFEEFLLAKNETHLHSALQNFTLNRPFNEALHEKTSQLFKEYLLVGGMPEAVVNWTQTHSLEALGQTHQDLIHTYKDDFSKYARRLSSHYLEAVFNAIPKYLTKKWIYSHVDRTAKQASIKQALRLLTKARLCHTIQSTAGNGFPFGAEADAKTFKMILLDVGLVSTLLGLKLHQFKTMDELMLVHQGALAEQGVGQLLRLLPPFYIDPSLYYWTRNAQGASAEVDYLIQHQLDIVPIEVKAGSEGKLRSLHQFMHEKHWPRAVRFYAGRALSSQMNVKTPQGHEVSYQLLSLPAYLTEQVHRLLRECR